MRLTEKSGLRRLELIVFPEDTMKHRLLSAVLILFSVSPCTAQEFPKRKPGLWEVTVASDNGQHVTRQCIDEATDAKLQNMGTQMGQMCTKQEARREGDAWVSEAECDMAGSRIHSKTVFRGDFTSNYQGDVSATYDPPLMGKREGKTKISAKWIGPCAGDHKPGDIILPDGQKMNLNSLGKVPGKQAR